MFDDSILTGSFSLVPVLQLRLDMTYGVTDLNFTNSDPLPMQALDYISVTFHDIPTKQCLLALNGELQVMNSKWC